MFYQRAITLLNVTYKVLSVTLYDRLAEQAEEILGDYHCGFRTNRSTTDHIFTIRQIQEKAYEYNIHLHNLYIDFKQAFDSVNRYGHTEEIEPTGGRDHGWIQGDCKSR